MNFNGGILVTGEIVCRKKIKIFGEKKRTKNLYKCYRLRFDYVVMA